MAADRESHRIEDGVGTAELPLDLAQEDDG